jgi:hypothetical protein
LVGAWVGNGLVTNLGDYESIATTTVGSGGQATITFASIPSTYKHLQIRYLALSAGTFTADNVARFNSDTGSNYAFHFIYGTGASALAAAASTQTSMVMGTTPDATYPCVAVVDILDYANTNKYKTVRTLAGIDRNGSGYVYLQSGLWQSTAAISTITINSPTGNYNQYSSFALYGIK